MLRVILCSLRQQARRATASIKKPIHNVKEVQADPAIQPEGWKLFRFISGVSWSSSAQRTDHPQANLLAKMVEPIGIEPMT